MHEYYADLAHFICTNLLLLTTDGSVVYGSDEATANSLRTFTDGLMKTSQDGQMLPEGPDGYEG